MKTRNSFEELKNVRRQDLIESIGIVQDGEPVAVLMDILEYRSLLSMAQLAEHIIETIGKPVTPEEALETHKAFQRDGEPPDAVELDDIDWDAPGGPKQKSATKPQAPVKSTFELADAGIVMNTIMVDEAEYDSLKISEKQLRMVMGLLTEAQRFYLGMLNMQVSLIDQKSEDGKKK